MFGGRSHRGIGEGGEKPRVGGEHDQHWCNRSVVLGGNAGDDIDVWADRVTQ